MTRLNRTLLWAGLAGLLFGFGLWLFPWSRAQEKPLAQRELATRILAEHLSQRFSGQCAMVISNPFTQRKGQRREIYAFEEAGIRGLRQGFGNSIRLKAVLFPTVRPEFFQHPEAVYVDPKTTTPLSYLVSDDAFDTLARQHSDCALMVSLIGVPANLAQAEFWKNRERPKLALLLPDLRLLGTREAVRQAVKSGKIAAMVLNKPGAPANDAAREKDYRAEFARRFFLVTAETVDEWMRNYPQLF
jgi:hypothetical protein